LSIDYFNFGIRANVFVRSQCGRRH